MIYCECECTNNVYIHIICVPIFYVIYILLSCLLVSCMNYSYYLRYAYVIIILSYIKQFSCQA